MGNTEDEGVFGRLLVPSSHGLFVAQVVKLYRTTHRTLSALALEFTVQYRKGKFNVVADAAFRSIAKSNSTRQADMSMLAKEDARS